MNPPPISRILASAILTVIALFATKSLWLKEGVSVQFDYEAQKDLSVQLFYCPAPDIPFTEGASIRERIQKGKGKVSVYIPTGSKIARFRLDTGSEPGKFEFSNLQIVGRERADLDLSRFTTTNIQSYRVENEKACVISTHRDPYLTYQAPLSIEGKKQIRWTSCVVILLSSVYFAFVLGDMFANKKTTAPHRDKSVTHVSGEPVPQAPPHTRRKLHNLDFLRILFTLGVLDFHFRFGLFKLHSTGIQGVEFFFILSGFLLMLTYRPERRLFEYAQQRYIRFVPLVILGGILAGGEWKSFLGVFMLQNTGMAYGNVPNAPSWYIAILFWCSLFYLGLIKTLSYRRMLMLVACLTFLTLIFVANIKGDRHPMMECLPLNRGLLRGVSCMGLGILLAHICKPGSFSHAIKPSIAAIFSLAEIGILAYIIVGCFNQSYTSSYWIFQPLSHVGLIGLFIVQAGLISRLTNKPIFSLLSNYCLSIYLTHWFCWVTVWKWVTNYYPTWIQENVELSLAIAFAISCLVGVLAHHLVEKPCTRYLTQFIKWIKDGISVQKQDS